MRKSSETIRVPAPRRPGFETTIIDKLRKISSARSIIVEFGLDSIPGTDKTASIRLSDSQKLTITLYKCPPVGDFAEPLVNAIKETLIYPLTSWKAWILTVSKARRIITISTGLLQALVLILIIMRLPESLLLALMLIALLMILSVVESIVEVARDAHLEKTRNLLDQIHDTLWRNNFLYRQRVESLVQLAREISTHACKVKGNPPKKGKGRIYVNLSLFNFKSKGNKILYTRIH